MKCAWHLCQNEVARLSKFGVEPKFCSSNCKISASVKRHRQSRKDRAVAYKGGKCESCGYDRSVRALCFHHTDPTLKAFPLTQSRMGNMPWKDITVELDKCVLLCSNCHAEVHDGLLVVGRVGNDPTTS